MAAVTIKDIATQLGVSPATVSLALNGRPGVNEETRTSVLNLANQLGYIPNNTKKTFPQQEVIHFLIYRKSGRIVTNTQFFTRLIESVEKAIRLQNYGLAIKYCEGPLQLEKSIADISAAQDLGILILGTEMNIADLAIVEKSSIPLIILDNELASSTLDMVSIHNYSGIWQAVQYLHEQNITDIGYLKSSISITNFDMRFMFYTYILPQFGIDVHPEKVFTLAPDINEAQLDMQNQLAADAKIPAALLADNDLIAIGAARALQNAGFKIPQDVSLIGFDNIPFAEYFQPALCSIEVPCEDLGARAVETLLWRIKNPQAAPQHIAVGTTLILRNSVAQL
ncbi:LacI family DNA-binding transcriptional regulator [Selenomonas ruminantium]|uniref:LacI family DNA-binding transcriptional regulator n=1 Tax=Selenomonas ruminantium TaxID=971 RepID=UPI001568B580|nr:LacI family DNA-binding transcriptional regulator [Selenomonas ruminantium]